MEKLRPYNKAAEMLPERSRRRAFSYGIHC